MIAILILLLFTTPSLQQLQCQDHQSAESCINSYDYFCMWNPTTNQCLQITSQTLGCNKLLNTLACLAQLMYPDQTPAECLFSSFCRQLDYVPTLCASIYSRAACLAVTDNYCLWNNHRCNTLTLEEAGALVNSGSTLLFYANAPICRLVKAQPCVHQKSAEPLLQLMRLDLMQSVAQEDTEKFLQITSILTIPGCINPLQIEGLISKMNCDSVGLNESACIKIPNYACIFQSGRCQQASDPSILKCTDSISQKACLSVTNISAPCAWRSDKCELVTVITCNADEIVSPSVCANVQSTECFYDWKTQKCKSMCRSAQNMSSLILCQQSTDSCSWNSKIGACEFSQPSQCELPGQNRLSCMKANQKCRFVGGFCYSVVSLNEHSCADGLNRLACLSLANPSQACQFDESTNTCVEIFVTPETRCTNLANVNSIACRKVSVEPCYFSSFNCVVALGSEVCSVTGLNRLGCFQVEQQPCQWITASGTCDTLKVTKSQACSTLQRVNATACRGVTYRLNGVEEICRYDSTFYSCTKITMSDSVVCSTPGLNEKGCASITKAKLACRWLSSQCVQVSSLGEAVSCSSLQSATSQTCALVSAAEKCKYDSSRQSCSTSVPPTLSCTDPGLNPHSCASLSASCYYDTTNKACVSSDPSAMNQIECKTNFPSKLTCIGISKQGQYCIWSQVESLCKLQEFPTRMLCTALKITNKNLCLAYETETTNWVEASHYCTYDQANSNCILHTGAIADCGTTADINMHACVAKSSTAKSCYFDINGLKCVEMTNNSVLQTLQCKQGNQKVCTQITTNGQACRWVSDAFQKKCYAISSVSGTCLSYQTVNSNVCAQVQGATACQWDNVSTNCVVPASTNLMCSTLGLNESGCVGSTQEACVYLDKKCQKVEGQTARKIRCKDKVNRLGCLALQGEACQWSSNSCQSVSKTWSSVTCTSLNENPYNPIVCSSVTTADQMCGYNWGTNSCLTVSIIQGCSVGYNQASCQGDCEFKDMICQSKPSPGSNDCQNKTESQCLSVTSAACMFNNGFCMSAQVNSSSTCSAYTSVTIKFNAVTCMSISKAGQPCRYDSTTFSCVAVTETNLPCNTSGLNREACIMKTQGSFCRFDSGFNSPNAGCTSIPNISNESCNDMMSKYSCVAIVASKGTCIFNVATLICNSVDTDALSEVSCGDAMNSSQHLYSVTYCKYLSGSACMYDTINFVCKAATTVSTCAQDASFNSIACLNYVSNETCQFSSSTCSIMTTLSSITCATAISFKQCTNAGSGKCKWNGSACGDVSVGVECTTLTNVNANACMQNSNGSQQCQFQDSGLSTACVIPPNNSQACYGLNLVACMANTANPCFYDNACYDILAKPDLAACDSNQSITQSACQRIQKSGQTCQWNGSNCAKITVGSADTCTQYSSQANSPQVCAAVQTSSCSWNNGCVSGSIANCSVAGANRLACVTALSGNCIFTNFRCFEVTTDNVASSLCSDPTNQNGCLKLNNGQPCQWLGSSCSTINAISNNCGTYTNVNSGVCTRTTDTACYWNNNECSVLTNTNSLCTEKGLNLIACLTKTNGSSCQFQNYVCKTVTGEDINSFSCEDNLNSQACRSHKTKCCRWDGTSCISAQSQSTCTAHTDYSQYCCTLVSAEKCVFTNGSCSTLLSQMAKCQDAANKSACMWLTSGCEWELLAGTTSVYQCVPQNKKDRGCVATLNASSCLQQTAHCMFVDQCKPATLTSCSNLAISNQTYNCKTVTDLGCKNGQTGCVLTVYNEQCTTPNINKIGCLDNINQCTWNESTSSCQQGPKDQQSSSCNTTGNISRGLCAQVANCVLNSSYSCVAVTIDDSTLCNVLNAVTTDNSNMCTKIKSQPCMFDTQKLKCTSSVAATDCTNTIVNEMGCKYVWNFCTWSGYCVLLSGQPKYYNCTSIFAKYVCLKNITTACEWDDSKHLCLNYSNVAKPCSAFTATYTSPGVCYYQSTNFCYHDGNTCKPQGSATDCTSALSPLGCQVASTNCYWEPSEAKCRELVNPNYATNMSCLQLKYSNRAFCLMPTGEGQTCHWNGTLCVSANVNTVKCTDDLALNACIAVQKPGEKCIYMSSKCQYATLSTISCTNNLNIYACVSATKDGEYCYWLGQRCAAVTQASIELSQFILVSQNVCRKVYLAAASPTTGVKYDPLKYICIPSNPQQDLCSTAGLNIYGCLSTQVDACDWNGSMCVSFSLTTTTTRCQDYQTVSPKVCQSISQSGLKCKHDPKSFNCKDFEEDYDNCQTVGLNKLACLNIKTEGCKWETSGKCSKVSVQIGITECLSLKDVNPMACALVDVAQQACRHNGSDSCTEEFNQFAQECDTSGLNRIGCVAVQRRKCQFQNGRCFYVQKEGEFCTALENVSSHVCKDFQSGNCKYSTIHGSCQSSNIKDQCSSAGLNKIGCALSSQKCVWFDDLKKCMCRGLANLYEIKQCDQLTNFNCGEGCLWDVRTGKCRLKVCSDLALNDCSFYLNTEYCYAAGQSCYSANSCADIFGVSDCTAHTVNGAKCGPDLKQTGHCVEFGCQHVEQASCGGDCTWDGKICVDRICEFMLQDSCRGTLNGRVCHWTGQSCMGLVNCQELNPYLTGETASQVCESYIIGGRKCSWATNCTSSKCRSLGHSKGNCQGAEWEGEVCVLLSNFNCMACEEISDACMCMEHKGYCHYSINKGCYSKSCLEYDKGDCELQSSRCVYSNQICKQRCSLLSKSACETRAQLNECHWSYDRCESGAPVQQTLNTITIESVEIVKFEKLLLASVLIVLLGGL